MLPGGRWWLGLRSGCLWFGSGRAALHAGDVEGAKRQLLESAKDDCSPRIHFLGPNMRLAKELLERGERDTVLEYIKRLRPVWDSGEDALDHWERTIREGGMPDFGHRGR